MRRWFALVLVSLNRFSEGLKNPEVTPLKKVVEMLGGMLAKARQDKEEEANLYSAFSQFCEDTSAEKTREIEEQGTRIETLSADIEKLSADAMTLGKEVTALTHDVGTWSQDSENATKIREKENADYLEMHKDYSESTDALERAIEVLKRQNYDRSQVFMQLQHLVSFPSVVKQLPEKARKVITNFLSLGMSEDPDYLSRSAPEAHAYEFQSGGVVDMLEKLLDKFIEERRTIEVEEANSRHTYELLVQDLSNEISQAKKAISKKSKVIAEKKSKAGEYRSELNEIKASKESDETYLTELKTECSQKASDFTERQKLRSEEIAALQEGLEILTSPELQASAQKYLPQMLQLKKSGNGSKLRIVSSHAASFLQKTSSASTPLMSKMKSFLQGKADKLDSPTLKLLAEAVRENSSVAAGGDPFEKVRNMIQDLIFRLQQQATEEAEHKGWCDREMAENTEIRAAKKEDVDRLASESDKLRADIARLKQDKADLETAINELQVAMASATDQRLSEKKRNEETIADSKASQAAVSSALTILREFYRKAGASTALLQQKTLAAGQEFPPTWDSAYTGLQGAKGGVIGMLEVIQTDFARLESETAAAESSAQAAYDKFKNDSEKDVAVKKTSVFHTEQMTVQHESQLSNVDRDLEATRKEYQAAMDYYEKLKVSCTNTGVSFEERSARREEEIQSLKEALRILLGEGTAE